MTEPKVCPTCGQSRRPTNATTCGPWPDLTEKPTIPVFETVEARDAMYAEWVAQGNELANGMMCVVGESPRHYLGGRWWMSRVEPWAS